MIIKHFHTPLQLAKLSTNITRWSTRLSLAFEEAFLLFQLNHSTEDQQATRNIDTVV